ncbi:hypothetical protein KEM55_001890 [Ascosphaera atra]|nr:hypothetical protein KEM55_001890 [Ascosphaera atra]
MDEAPKEKSNQELLAEIQALQLRIKQYEGNADNHPTIAARNLNRPSINSIHPLLLLADSALPLGSFAYSSGLESYIAHNKSAPRGQGQSQGQATLSSFQKFLSLSVASLASTTLPYLLRAHQHPEDLEDLDNDLDASTLCTVARRASLAQGLALLNVWERAFRDSFPAQSPHPTQQEEAHASLTAFSRELKRTYSVKCAEDRVNGHFAPLWGVVCAAMNVNVEDCAYVFVLNHAKAVLSAAVRASIMGPYQAQAILASPELQQLIIERMRKEWDRKVEEAGQVVPVMDLWMGRHELLYSRIFNS